jgi:hypothetical protein
VLQSPDKYFSASLENLETLDSKLFSMPIGDNVITDLIRVNFFYVKFSSVNKISLCITVTEESK